MARSEQRLRSGPAQAALRIEPSITRRAFAGLLAASLFAQKGRSFPSEFHRYADPATELDVYRLTSPQVSSYLSASYQRSIARRGGFLLYASDRAGALQVFRLDLKNGESRQLTEAADLSPSSISLLPNERSFCYFDGPALRQGLTGEREIYRIPEGWERGNGFALSDDGLHAVVPEKQGAKSRLRLINLLKGAPSAVLELDGEVGMPLPRPKRAQILYRREQALWLVDLDGQNNRRLKTDTAASMLWNPSGRTFVYLHIPDSAGELNSLREHTPDENADRLLAKTSQFAAFGENGDASVFVGASRSKASPNVLLLLRSAHREFTLCEHKATDAAAVAPIFSPDSQSIFFQSDRDGKSAIYRMRVDALVDETQD